MSGDVQPRKRKEKRRKRDDDESSHGVHITKMGNEDVHLHVHHEHGTGGHWCAKIIFFSLMAVLLGLVSLIILENRGLTDLDTPLSESRFSNYFDGWVEERRDEHDEHDAVEEKLHSVDDQHEPFEEEDEDENQSELDEDHEADDEEDGEHDDEEHDDEDNEDDEAEAEAEEKGEEQDDDDEADEEAEVEQEVEDENDDEDDDEEEEVQHTAEQEDDDQDQDDEDQADEDQDDEDEAAEDQDDDDKADDDQADDDQEDDDQDQADEDDDNEENATVEAQHTEEAQDDNDDDDDEVLNNKEDEDDEEDDDEDELEKSADNRSTYNKNVVDDNDGFDEEDDDDDDTFDSLDNVVENDAEELKLLQQKAIQQAAQNAQQNQPTDDKDNDDDDDDSQKPEESSSSSWAASLEEPSTDILMKRRLTIASAEENIPTDDDEEPPPLPEDDYSEEELEIEEEIEYEEGVDDAYEEDEEELELEAPESDAAENDDMSAVKGHYVPETFEQLNAMYRPKPSQNDEPTVSAAASEKQQIKQSAPPIFKAPPPPPLVAAKILHKAAETVTPASQRKREVADGDDIEILYAGSDEHVEPLAISDDEDNVDAAHRQLAVEDDEDEDEDEDEDDESYDLDDLDDNEGDISDIDDTELMNRLEAKYGRLPAKEYESDEDPDDPTWTQIKVKETKDAAGQPANAAGDENLNEFERELRRANEAMLHENYANAMKLYAVLTQKYANQPRVFLAHAKALDRIADIQRSNKLLESALEAYKRYLAFADATETPDAEYVAAAERCIERMRFMGYHLQAVPIHEQLIVRFSDEPKYRNQLSLTYLMMNRLTDVKSVAAATLSRWPSDGLAQLHYGFALKQLDNAYTEAVDYMQRGLLSGAEGTQEGFYYFTLGATLQRLGRQNEAYALYKRAVQMQLFPSIYQRSLYNEPHLRAQPFWRSTETGYAGQLQQLKANWQAIRDEALALLNHRGYFRPEEENLRDTGDWQQFQLYVRGQRQHKNCQKAPITCALVSRFTAASSCRRGQVKFSVMQAGTHVWPHCGPTNCRLRAHLGLVVPQGVKLRVANTERRWREGEFLIFDDSFEHEVWHNGTSLRLVLIMDIWHPDLNLQQRQTLSAI